jgi:hypothetical protein
MAPLMGPKKGFHFFRGHISLRMGPFAPFLATLQALSKTYAFLLSEKKQRLLCMGRTFTANKLLPLNNSPKQLSVSLGSNLARVKASKN